MPTSPLVSIITPSYNQAEYLESTITSVLLQDYGPIEYLIVDGSSTDNSVEIIQKYAHLAQDRLVWWTSEPDSGQAEAINKGFKHANGEIIAWINSDDIYLPGAISSAVTTLEEKPALGLVFGDAITIDARGTPINRLTFGDWGLAELAAFRIICQPSVFMRRSSLESAGYLDDAYHYMLDHHLWIRIARDAPIKYAGKHVSSPWAAARHHDLAKNVSQAELFSDEILKLLEWLGDQPDLEPLVNAHSQHMTGGAYRLSGRYLLDGGLPRAALRSYGRALRTWPGYTIKHWHRILYASLQALGLDRIADALDRYRLRQSEQHSSDLSKSLREQLQSLLEQISLRGSASPLEYPQSIDDWPGLYLR
jgi:hypothetical protein